jgi:hypothetical protein
VRAAISSCVRITLRRLRLAAPAMPRRDRND